MQENHYNYLNEEGCCLNCEYASTGCLCTECKCTKCYWYSPPSKYDREKGKCDYVEVLKQKRKQEMIDYYEEIERKKYEISKKLEKKNEELREEAKKNGEIINSYTCQKCKREFLTKEEHKIVLNHYPVCSFCGKEDALNTLSFFSDAEMEQAGWTRKELVGLIDEIYGVENDM
jgi:hypothetical protein